MRGIAALLVVFFHYRFFLRTSPQDMHTIWDSLFGWGILGVDIFFVISGFIMVYTTWAYSTGYASSCKFLLNRLTRIIPLYYLGLLAALFLGGGMSTFHYADKAQNFFSALTFTVYRTDITPHYIDDSGMYNVRWTLNYEMYFYIIFALCLLVKHRVIALMLWAFFATCLIPFMFGYTPTLSVSGYHVGTAVYGLLSNPVIIEFLIGAVSACMYFALKNAFRRKLLIKPAAVIATTLFAIVTCMGSTGLLSPLNPQTACIIGLLILSLALGEPLLAKWLPKPLVYLGEISFSLYLFHLTIGRAIFDRIEHIANNQWEKLLFATLALLLSIAVSHITHKYVEVKFTNWLKGKFKARRKNPVVNFS